MKKVLLERLALRGLSLAPVEPSMTEASPSASGVAPAGEANAAQAAGRTGSNGAEPVRLTGDFTTREDVIRALDKICEYYRRYEPSSPVPLFLNRAKRLASKSFLEILRDLTPDALNQALSLGGISDAEPDAEK
jgi:type VI secretion system protein ImpA